MSSLASFAATLAALDPDLPIELDGKSGLNMHSWRGYYAEPSIDHGRSRFAAEWRTNTDYGFAFEEATKHLTFEPAETVGQMLRVVEAVRAGAGLNGWKGGVYTAAESATVYADEEGCCPGRIVLGIEVVDGTARINVSDPS